MFYTGYKLFSILLFLQKWQHNIMLTLPYSVVNVSRLGDAIIY